MPRPCPPYTVETTLLSPWPDPLATAVPTPSLGWEPGPGGGELQRRVTTCYAQLRALPRRVRRALQRKLALPLAGVALLLALGQGPSQAATTWTVCASGCKYPTIQAAINAATTAAGDVISVRDPVHTEAGITVTKDLSIAGQGADTTVVQAAATLDTAHDRVFIIAPGVTVSIQELTIRHGSTRDVAGGGGLLNEGTLTVTNSTISGNTVSRTSGYYGTYGGSGGGLHNTGTLTLTDSTVSSNFAARGGGLYNTGTLTLTNSTVSGNSAILGGGLHNEGTLTVTNSTISDNFAFDGGGLFNYDTLTLTNSTVSGNFAGAGGGLFNSFDWTQWTHSTVTLTNSTISGNSAVFGGGLLNTGYPSSTLTLINSTVSGNSATYGGGLWNYGTLTLTNSTITGNSAGHGGGLYNYVYTGHGAFYEGDVRLINSIVAINPYGGDCRVGSITFHSYSLDSDGSCRLTAPTDRPGVDPLLGPLQDNGGPTFTQALLPGSPAIDAIPWGTNGCGTTLVSDQRWQARPQPAGGACDIGAYEVAVAGQPLGGWVTGFTPHTVTCENVTTGQAVTLSDPATSWDCEAAGLGVTPGDQVALRVRGPIEKGATDVGGAVAGMAPTSGGCTNLTTGQQVKFQHMVGATAGSCVAAGLVVHPGDSVQMHVQGVAE